MTSTLLCFGCPHSIRHKMPFYFLFCFHSSLLPKAEGAERICAFEGYASGRQCLDGLWSAILMGISPPQGSPAAAPIAISVAGRKYHFVMLRSEASRFSLPEGIRFSPCLSRNFARSTVFALSFSSSVK